MTDFVGPTEVTLTVGLRALKQSASSVVAEAASGATITITDCGRPVAQLTPIPTGRLDRVSLRSLDALHLAAALELGDDLDGFITYDRRLADAATALGIPVSSPS